MTTPTFDPTQPFEAVKPTATPEPAATPTFDPNQDFQMKGLVERAVENAPAPQPAPPAQPRGVTETVYDSFRQEANKGFSGLLARNAMAITGLGLPDEVSALPYAERMAVLENAARKIEDHYNTIREKDPSTWRQLYGDITGGIVGGADPTMLLSGGGKIGWRVLKAMGYNAAGDVAEQGIDMNAGIQDAYDPRRTGIAAAGGAAFETLFGSLAKAFGKDRVELAADGTPIVRQENSDGTTTIYTDPESGVVIDQNGGEKLFGKNQRGANWNPETEGIVVTGDKSRLNDRPLDEMTLEERYAAEGNPVDPVDPNAKASYGRMTPEEEQAYAEASFEVMNELHGVDNKLSTNMDEIDFKRQVGWKLKEKGFDPNIVHKDPYVPGEDATGGINPQIIDGPGHPDDGILPQGDTAPNVETVDPVTRNNPTPLPSNDNTGPKSFEHAAADYEAARARWVEKNGDPSAMIDARKRQARGEAPPGDGGAGDGTPPSGPPDMGDIFKRVTKALKNAKSLSKEQEALRAAERSRRWRGVKYAQETTEGMDTVAAQEAALKGKMPSKDFEAIADQFSQQDLVALFKHVKSDPRLTLTQKFNAQRGLRSMLEGDLPQPAQIALLERTLPKDLISALRSNRGLGTKVIDALGSGLNLPRAIMSSFDLSAPFRQGVFLVGRKEFWKAMPGMGKAMFSKKAHSEIMDEIMTRPTYELMERSKLALAEMGSDLNSKEEAYMSGWTNRIPGVAGSERAYTGFLNKLRADVFDDLISKSKAAGIDFDQDPKALNDIASFINNATGRGNLSGNIGRAAPFLNSLFFSPRLLASRVQLMNPAYYATLSPVVRQEAIKSLINFGTIASTVIGMMGAAGAEVEMDPRSTNFGKGRFPESDSKVENFARTLPAGLGVGVQTYDGETRYDVLGGFQPLIRLFARIASDSTKTSKGEVKEFGTKMADSNRLTTLAEFARTKAAPIPGYIMDWAEGQNAVGEPFDFTSNTAKLFVPLFIQDLYNVLQDPEVEFDKNAAFTKETK